MKRIQVVAGMMLAACCLLPSATSMAQRGGARAPKLEVESLWPKPFPVAEALDSRIGDRRHRGRAGSHLGRASRRRLAAEQREGPDARAVGQLAAASRRRRCSEFDAAGTLRRELGSEDRHGLRLAGQSVGHRRRPQGQRRGSAADCRRLRSRRRGRARARGAPAAGARGDAPLPALAAMRPPHRLPRPAADAAPQSRCHRPTRRC